MWQGLELHGVLGGTGCGGVCMALWRGVGEMCWSRKIPQIGSKQHAKKDFKIIDDLRRGRKIKSASCGILNARTGAKCEKKEESQNHRMQWHLWVSASGNRQRQTGEESREVSREFSLWGWWWRAANSGGEEGKCYAQYSQNSPDCPTAEILCRQHT